MTRPYADLPLADLVEGYRAMRLALEQIRAIADDDTRDVTDCVFEIEHLARQTLEALK